MDFTTIREGNSKRNPVYNTQVWVLTVSEEENEEEEGEEEMLRGSVMLSLIGKIASCFAER